jgi:hypothetical protein
VIAVAASRSAGAAATLAAGSDFFATDAHYESLGGRIVAAVRDRSRFILVTGDPPVSPHLLSAALSKVAWPHHTVSDIHCGPELRGDGLPRPSAAVAPRRASDGETGEPDPAVPPSPLLVFDDLDRLSEQQIQKIREAILCEENASTAAVLLAQRGCLAPLEMRALCFLEEGLGVHFRLQEVGPDESIAYLRHQLARIQQHSRALRLPRGVFGGLLASGFVITASIGAFVFVHPIVERVGGPSSAATDNSSNAQALAPERTIDGVLRAVSAQAAPTSEPAPIAATAPPAFALVPPEGTPTVTPPIAPVPVPPSSGSRLSAAEIAAFLARGDKFLAIGDIASARLFYERAADAGDASAALRLGTTFDPAFLKRAGMHGNFGAPAQALSWYRRARDLGSADAERWLKRLETNHLTDSDARAR